MPEGPEASFLATYIEQRYTNCMLKTFDIVRGRYKNHGPPFNYHNFIKDLPLKLLKVEKKGKVIFFHFENGWNIISKLGMTGWWYMEGDEPQWRKAGTNEVFGFNRKKPLIFDDFRSYGTLTITKDTSVINDEKNKLANDVMSAGWGPKDMIKIISSFPKRHSLLVEDAIMDQQFFISGVGNYLKAEILYDAKISPLRNLSSVSDEEWKKLYKSARKLSHNMYKVLMLRDDKKYMSSMKIYGREKDPYGNVIEKHTASNGRATFWVPQIQK
jgi:formamidopyrimidine-DNA glycosylase